MTWDSLSHLWISVLLLGEMRVQVRMSPACLQLRDELYLGHTAPERPSAQKQLFLVP